VQFAAFKDKALVDKLQGLPTWQQMQELDTWFDPDEVMAMYLFEDERLNTISVDIFSEETIGFAKINMGTSHHQSNKNPSSLTVHVPQAAQKCLRAYLAILLTNIKHKKKEYRMRSGFSKANAGDSSRRSSTKSPAGTNKICQGARSDHPRVHYHHCSITNASQKHPHTK
jgi:hypothetical protein